ncbi:uncharacterized protein HfgLR_09720 [Haloferax gibbonsii]|uniref:Uncharacterized protein n=1 Tax=Haloferax gibbonsii TaxID=35746 RepID=A0A871BHE0_HALGI|nr:uncharacterized protein HfgLR_09720 [Haloferax gibbonsii]
MRKTIISHTRTAGDDRHRDLTVHRAANNGFLVARRNVSHGRS